MEDIRDIKSQLSLPFELDWWMWLALGLTVLAAAVLLYFRFIKKKKDFSETIQKPLVPEDVEALQAIDRLVGKAYPDMGRFKEFTFELALILRRYLEKRFSIPVTEKTTEEFLNELAGQSYLNDFQKETLKSFLLAADMIKFAKQQTSVKECREFEGIARKLIQETAKKNEL